MSRIVTKYGLTMQAEQTVEFSVAGAIVGLTIEDNALKILVDQEASPLRTRPRTFYIVRPEIQMPDAALRFLGQFALDDSVAFLYTETDDTPTSYIPDAPLVVWSDVAELQSRVLALEARLVALESDNELPDDGS